MMLLSEKEKEIQALADEYARKVVRTELFKWSRFYLVVAGEVVQTNSTSANRHQVIPCALRENLDSHQHQVLKRSNSKRANGGSGSSNNICDHQRCGSGDTHNEAGLRLRQHLRKTLGQNFRSRP